MERSQGRATSEGSLLQVAYQETREAVTFATRDLANQAMDGKRPLYVSNFLGASQIKRTLVDIGASTNFLALPTLDALGIPRETTSSSRNRIVAVVHLRACIFGFEGRTH